MPHWITIWVSLPLGFDEALAHAPAARTRAAAASSRATLLLPSFCNRTLPASSLLTLARDSAADMSDRLSSETTSRPIHRHFT